jgi:hypothetical protein
MAEESYERKVGPVPLGAWRAIRFEFGDREPAVLQPFGREVDALLEAHRAAQSATAGDDIRWDALAEVVLMTTSRGPFEEDVFFVLTFDDGSDRLIPARCGTGPSDKTAGPARVRQRDLHSRDGRQRRRRLGVVAPMKINCRASGKPVPYIELASIWARKPRSTTEF